MGTGRFIDVGEFLVQGSSIIEVASPGSIVVPPNTAVVELDGKIVSPAFIDAHAHLGFEGYGSWGATNYTRDNLVDHLHRYAYYGFSAVFSAGSDLNELAIELQQAQQQGMVGGARFLFAAGMAPPGQGPNNQILEHVMALESDTGMTILRGVDSPQQVESAVEAVSALGIPYIKIWG